ncbi:MAG TPA: DNA repair protein RecO [Xanthobacteraceae bacterium]|nr:DNA repair protein RecO [Xanthobacteraceae bacterium]
MEWVDDGIVLGVRRHGEGNAIVELMTAAHGRHLGLVRGGSSRRQAPLIQPGNGVRATWRARIDEQLGAYVLEATRSRSDRLMAHAHAAFGFQHVSALVRLLPERDPHPALHAVLDVIVDRLDDAHLAGPLVARFELLMLSELGFGLELDQCAVTGGRNDLLYVSPKTGRAVSRDIGEPWQRQLLALPFFLVGEPSEMPAGADLAAAFDLTGYFLLRRVFEPRGLAMPDTRAAFIGALARAVEAQRR